MSSPLEKFILENREKFDADTPDPRVWDKISERMNPETEKSVPIRSIPFRRWMAVAAVLLVAVTGTLYYSLHKNKLQSTIAGTTDHRGESSNQQSGVNLPADSPSQIARTIPDIQQKKNPDVQDLGVSGKTENNSPDNGDNKEMYYYAKLIELKHEELKTLEKDEPLLYRQFSSDVQKLDSVRPFLEYEDRWTILLGLTSNTGAADFELQTCENGLLFESVIRKASQWGTTENLMFVIGATQAEWFTHVRTLAPDHFYLVPGVGVQGGSLKEISLQALNKDFGLLVNASRAIIYAGSGEDFAEKAGQVAAGYSSEMSGYLEKLKVKNSAKS